MKLNEKYEIRKIINKNLHSFLLSGSFLFIEVIDFFGQLLSLKYYEFIHTRRVIVDARNLNAPRKTDIRNLLFSRNQSSVLLLERNVFNSLPMQDKLIANLKYHSQQHLRRLLKF